MKITNARLILASVIFLIVGTAIGWYVHAYEVSRIVAPIASAGQVRVNLPQYKFINPPLFSDSQKFHNPQFDRLAYSLDFYINNQKDEKNIEAASVYFRDLNAGQWTGVNENDLYAPSSMLKVVAMLAVLKIAETDQSILSEKLHYTKPKADSPYSFSAPNTTDGEYSIQDLIVFMIKYSDNGALDALVSNPRINAEFVQIYSLFRLPQSGLAGTTTDFMSPKSFSAVLRTLYNSSFFEWGLSEQVLELLSKTTYINGLVAGVPIGTTVSHKFGENTNELHDCGIVYYPKHPYLLCVMTKGTQADQLETTIQHISKIAWDFVDQGGLGGK